MAPSRVESSRNASASSSSSAGNAAPAPPGAAVPASRRAIHTAGPWEPGTPIVFADDMPLPPPPASAPRATSPQVSRAPQPSAKHLAIVRKLARKQREAKRTELEEGLEVYSYTRPATLRSSTASASASASGSGDKGKARQSDADDQLAAFALPTKAPKLTYITTSFDADLVLSGMGDGPFGFDMEWDANMKKGGEEGSTAVIQLCSTSHIAILHLSAMDKTPAELTRILGDPNMIKCGVAIAGDCRKLHKDRGIECKGAVELSHVVKLAFPHDWRKTTGGLYALRDQARKHLQRKLLKDSVRTSQWSKVPLSERQIEYGACDTYASLELLLLYVQELRQKQHDAAAKKQQTLDSAAIEKHVHGLLLSCSTNQAPAAISTGEGAPAKPATAKASAKAAKNEKEPRPKPEALVESIRRGNAVDFFTHTYQRAFQLWHQEKQPLSDIAVAMRSKENPLKLATVMGYVLRALEETQAIEMEDEVRDRLKVELDSDEMVYLKQKHQYFLDRQGIVPLPAPIEVADSSVDL